MTVPDVQDLAMIPSAFCTVDYPESTIQTHQNQKSSCAECILTDFLGIVMIERNSAVDPRFHAYASASRNCSKTDGPCLRLTRLFSFRGKYRNNCRTERDQKADG